MLLLLLPILLFLFASSCASLYCPKTFHEALHYEWRPEDAERLYPPEALRSDLEFLAETLEAAHPNPFAFTDAEVFRAECARVRDLLHRPMTRAEFYREVGPLVSLVRDGHTQLELPWEDWNHLRSQGRKDFPLGLFLQREEIWVASNESDEPSIEPGMRVEAIQGKPAREILRELLPYASGELEGWRLALAQQRVSPLFWILYDWKEPIDVAVSDGSDAVRTFSIRRRLRDEREEEYQRGYRLQKEKRYGEAVELFRRILDRDPGDANALFQLGRTRLMAGDELDIAESCFRKYLESPRRPPSPSRADARCLLGYVLFRQGRSEESRAEFQAALELEPGLLRAWDGLYGLSEHGNPLQQPVPGNCDGWDFHVLPDLGAAYLRVRSFAIYDGETAGQYREFLKRCFALIHRKNLSFLILDIRGNGGGNSVHGDDILEYLTERPYAQFSKVQFKGSLQYRCFLRSKFPAPLRWLPWEWAPDWAVPEPFSFNPFAVPPGRLVETQEPKRTPAGNPLRFAGRTFLLIDRDVFSSGSSFAGAFQDLGLGTIVGEESGGLPSGYGELCSFRLPSTRLSASCSTKRFVRGSGAEDGRGVLPHHSIPRAREDLGRSGDLVLDFTLRSIRESPKRIYRGEAPAPTGSAR